MFTILFMLACLATPKFNDWTVKCMNDSDNL